MTRDVEVSITLKPDGFKAGAQVVQQQAQVLARRIADLNARATQEMLEQAELMAGIATEHARRVTAEMQRWQKGVEILDRTAQAAAGLGAVITGSLVSSINAYLKSAEESDAVVHAWRESTDSLAESQQRVGRVAASAALPALEKAADLAGKAAAFAERNPDVIRAALNVGGALAVLGAVGMAVSKGIRLYTDVTQLSAQLLAAKLQKEAAEKQLLAAGIQVKTIPGLLGSALTRSLIPGAQAAVGGTLAGRMAMATGTSAATVAGVPLTAARGVTGASLLAALSPLTALGGLAAGVAGFEALARTNFGQEIGMQAGASGKALSILAYGLGSLVGKGNEAFTAVAQWTGQMEKVAAVAQTPIVTNETPAQRALPDTQQGQAARVVETERAIARQRAQEVMNAAQAVIAIEQRMADERRAIMADFRQESAEIERQRGRDAQLEALRAGWAVLDAERQQAQQRAQIQAQYQKAVQQATVQFARAQAQAAQQYARQQEDIERQYQQRIADIQRQYEEDEWEAVLNRDAAALYRAQRRRDQELATAGEQRAEQQQQAAQQYQDALNAARQAQQESLAQAQQAQQESLASLEASIQSELEAKRRAEERARIEQQMQLAWQEQDRQIYLQRRYVQVVSAYAAELQAAQNYYTNLIRLDQNYRASNAVSVPTGTGRPARPTAYAEGGYAVGGLSLLHAGEFVLNPQTTRRLETAVGGSLTQQNVLGGVNVGVNVNGMGLGAREVARLVGAQVEAQLYQTLADAG